ncbi:hypothetical protein SPOG_04463 [Schizosaccharomyces cryophilus OY26]|uniref:Uncharacterized protein n=1 Tax=Schizosaccharomyces cryophilus (strain OY26 / ATCC MYA-4695 / CBS 11777 / NBRC 106824 / NRRL Y48691) TaxID=653667 RepID=S9X5W1_SCHCR|nr:uncharacterized protein SPOG_04463 [Schizosaccharomyces cryophilus OY26]EPY49181.1 hypothetical protein SPOG_04463 [Schizosaccharomyces cryophilus OY26]
MKNGSGIDNSFNNGEFHLSDQNSGLQNSVSSGSVNTAVNGEARTQDVGSSFSDTDSQLSDPNSSSILSRLSQTTKSSHQLRFFKWVRKLSENLQVGKESSSNGAAEGNSTDPYIELVSDPAYIPVLKQIGGFDEIRDNLVLTDSNFDVKDYDVKFMYLLRKYLLDGPDTGFVVQHEKYMPDGPRVAAAKAHSALAEKLAYFATNPGSSEIDVDKGSFNAANEEGVQSAMNEQNVKSINHSVQVQETNDRLRAVSQLETIRNESKASSEQANDFGLFVIDSEIPDYHLGNEPKRKEILDLYVELAKNNDLVIGHTVKDTYFFVFKEDSLLPLEKYEYTAKELSLFNIQQKASRWMFRKTQEERLIHWEQLPFKVESLNHIPFVVKDNSNQQDKSEMPFSVRELAYMETRFIALILPTNLQKYNYQVHRTLARARDFQSSRSKEDEIAYIMELEKNPVKFLFELDIMESLPLNQQRALWVHLADFASKQETDPLLSLWKRQVILCRIGHPKLHTVPISSFFCVENQPRLIGVKTASATSFFLVDRDFTTYDAKTMRLLSTAPSRSAQNWLLVMQHLEFLGRSFPHLVHLDKHYGFLDYQMEYFRNYTDTNMQQPVKSTSNCQEVMMQQV